MSIDLDRDQLVPLVQAGHHYPGKRPHVATTFRHALKGVRGVRLETAMVGGRRYTSVEAIRRFLTTINTKSPLGNVPVFGDHDAQVEEKLKRHGL